MRATGSPLGRHSKTPRVFGVADRRIQVAADYFQCLLECDFPTCEMYGLLVAAAVGFGGAAAFGEQSHMGSEEQLPGLPVVYDDRLSAAELAVLWRLALDLPWCQSAREAEAAAAAATGGGPSPEFERAVGETLAVAVGAIHDRERLLDLAIYDPLTGLANRRVMEEELARQLHQVSGLGQPLAVAMMDLDYFRDVNEGHGHLAGDLVLRALAVLLQGFRRGSDLPCRYGGDEFVLIMSGATATAAAARLDRLRERLAESGIHHEGRPLEPVTVSIGVAEFPATGQTVGGLIDAADEALYQAKRTGRNRICLAGPTSDG